MKNYYNDIDKAIKFYEDCRLYHTHDIDWICNRIDWCWKFRKITSDQKDQLCDRIISIMNNLKI